jgi:hypothetical protein
VVTFLVKSSYHPRLPRVSASKHLSPSLVTLHHRDENPVTISPLESAFKNCDARNPFRIRSYENCRVSPASSCFFFCCLSLHGTLSFVSFHTVTNCKFHKSFVLTFIQNAGGVLTPLLLHSLPNLATRHLRPATSFPSVSKSSRTLLSRRHEGHSNHKYFKSFKMRSYTIWPCKSSRMCSSEKNGGGVAIPESPVTIFACVMISFRSKKASAS